jgi:hypothetical protein
MMHMNARANNNRKGHQRRWQLAHRAKGLCEMCSEPRYAYVLKSGEIRLSPLCQRHFDGKRALRQERDGSITEYAKKPPAKPKPE